MFETVWKTEIPHLPPPRRGKVRDIYELGDMLLIVACDRISAYDHILQPGIPGKGKILSQLTNFWFDRLADIVPNHLISTDTVDFPSHLVPERELLEGRSVLVRKAEVIPYECVVRGYLAGSAFREYMASGAVCDIELPEGLERADRLPEPIFTPATKAESGHDENISFAIMFEGMDRETAETLRETSLSLYQHGAEHLAERDLILADTKFEFGWIDGQIHIIDEVFTPDSSRFWDAHKWQPGTEPVSFDKQYVRNWLDECGWDHESPPPDLPTEVVDGTLGRYLEAFRKITGREPAL